MSDVTITTITIVGTGAIGMSLGLALKKIDDPPRLVGHDKDFSTSKLAQKEGAFDKIEWNLINACDQADAIILALPSSEMKATLEATAPYLKEHVVITDTASTKKAVVDMAEAVLPEQAHFIGGHPIVSTLGLGPTHAHGDLFQKAIYCLTPTTKAHPDAVKFLQDMVGLIGATPLFLDPEEHDGLACGVNLLPQLLGLALVSGVSQQKSWLEMRRLAGQLFAQVSNGAVGDPDAIAAALLENPQNTLRWLDTMRAEMDTLKQLIQTQDPEALAQAIDKVVVMRQNWFRDFEQNNLYELLPDQVSAPIEKPNLLGNLFGHWGRRTRH